MFLRDETGFGPMAGHGGGGAAALTFGQALPLDARAPATRPGWRNDWRERLAGLDLVVDLGTRIGSRDWWRGLATCTFLCGGAIATAPGIMPLPGASPMPMPEAHWQQARALGFAPLALGADTGRRMAATNAVEPLTDTPERPTVDLTATIGRGDGFARVLERAGVDRREAESVARLLAAIVPSGQIKPGTRMNLTLGRRSDRTAARPLDALALRARFDLRVEFAKVDGVLRLRRVPIAVDATPLRVRGRVGPGLYASLRAAGVPGGAISVYIRALSARMSIARSVSAGDRFDLIVERRRAATGEVEMGDLVYAGLDQGKRRTSLLRWTSGGRSQFFEASGVGEQRGAMTRPVAGRLTSGFGMRRHPLLGFSRFHRGVDFGAPRGASIVATSDGVVSFAGWHGGHGKYVKLSHGGGLATAYGHMSRIAAKAGARVARGQVIGYVGSTGMSTGPHLHYEVWKNGVAVNPNGMRFSTTSQLAGNDLRQFRATLAQLMTVKPDMRQAPVPGGDR